VKRSKEFENAVKEYLDIKGIEYIRVDNYRCYKCGTIQNSQASGFPDFLCLHPLVAIECKTGTGRLTKKQTEVLMLLELSGVDVIVLRDTLDDLIKYFENKA